MNIPNNSERKIVIDKDMDETMNGLFQQALGEFVARLPKRYRNVKYISQRSHMVEHKITAQPAIYASRTLFYLNSIVFSVHASVSTVGVVVFTQWHGGKSIDVDELNEILAESNGRLQLAYMNTIDDANEGGKVH